MTPGSDVSIRARRPSGEHADVLRPDGDAGGRRRARGAPCAGRPMRQWPASAPFISTVTAGSPPARAAADAAAQQHGLAEEVPHEGGGGCS